MEDLIEQYIKGRLPAAERAAFEARLSSDAELREAVELAKLAHGATWSHHQLELRQAALQALRRERTRPYRRLAVLGLLLLVAAWLTYRWLSGDTRPAPAPAPSGPVADRFYTRPETDAYLATAADENERQFNLAKQAYDAQNCAEAQPILQKLAETPDFKYRTESRLLLAACQYEQPDQLPRAIANLQTIVSAGPPADFTTQQAEWYLALAYSKNGETARAQELLEAMAARADHAYSAEARRMLEAVK